MAPGVVDGDLGRHPDEVLDGEGEPARSGRAMFVRGRVRARLDEDLHLVEPALARQHDLVMRRQRLDLEQLLLDLGREDIDAAHDHHVVGAPRDLLHAPHRARRARQQPREVARAIADHRHRLLGERGEDELAFLAVRQARAGRGVDHLGEEMILPDMQPILGLDAFIGHARPHHLGKPVDVDRMHVERRPRSRARMALVQGSAPKMPIFSEEARGSTPCLRNSSRMASM